MTGPCSRRPGVPRSRPGMTRRRDSTLARPTFVTATETVSAPRDGSPSGDAERWLPGRSRPRPGKPLWHLHARADVADRVVTAVAERAPVVELEPLARRASSPLFVLVAASASVPLVDGSLHRGRDLARGGGGLALRERLSRRLGSGETPGFEPLELLGDGLLDDRAEVAVGHRGAHEGLQALELVTELGGGGELHPVAARGEGLDLSGPGPGRGAAARPLAGGSPFDRRPPQLRLDAVRARARQLRPDGVGDRPKHLPPDAVREKAPRRPGRLGWPATSSPPVGRAASAPPPEHPDGAKAPPRAPRSRASTGGRPASRRASRFSRVRCGASFAMAVRCSLPSASMVRRRGCSRAARAAAIRR